MKFIGAALIFLTLASTVVVVAQSCHESQRISETAVSNTHASHSDHQHAPPATDGLSGAGLITEICAGIFYLVLLFGGRFLLKNVHPSFNPKILILKSRLPVLRDRFEFNLTLTLPQLGICRI